MKKAGLTTGLYMEMLDYMREQSKVSAEAKEIMQRYDDRLRLQHSALKALLDNGECVA